MYGLARSILFQLDAEKAHHVSMATLRATQSAGLLSTFTKSIPEHPVKCMGLDFPNPIGLAAGLDKEGNTIDALGQLGFGFIEIGTLTPKPQDGNPQPRLFRLKPEQAIINRMGFNNRGVSYLVDRVRNTRFDGVLGINIGKNKDTPLDRAHEDYQHCMQRVYSLADYITVNISSPNTPGLRDLQVGEATRKLLTEVKTTQQVLADKHGRYVPVAVKVAPDMAEQDVNDFCDSAIALKIDAIIATNTTLSRPDLTSVHADETGGLSGKPVTDKALQTVAQLAQRLQKEIPVIGCGGIFSGDDALAYLEAGASLVQIYTGFIYRGPKLISEIRQSIHHTET